MKKTQMEDRKLKLSKQTLRTLSASELARVDGGLITIISRGQPDHKTVKTHG